MKHSITTILIAVLMSMIGVNVFAHDIAVANSNGVTIYYNWINNMTELSVSYQGSSSSDYSNEYTGSIVIPSSVVYQGNTYSVTSIGSSAFVGCSGLTSIAIPNSVASIHDEAFMGCSGLTSVIIPYSVTSIGYGVFIGCSSLVSVTIPSSMTYIGPATFKGCSSLSSVTIPNSVRLIGNLAFYNCTGLTKIISEIENPLIVDDIFSCNDKDIYASATLVVPPGKKSVYQNTDGWNLFSNIVEAELIGYEFESSGIRYRIGQNNTVSVISKKGGYYSGDVVIPSSVVYHGKTYSVTSIDTWAFFGCDNLTSVTIPNSVTTIGDMAFQECGLTSITIPNSVTRIGLEAFKCCNLTSVSIPNSVTFIAKGAFSDCRGLTSVTIPNSVTSIGDEAFYACSGLTSVTIPNSVTSIGDDAFSACSGLTSITIPNSVTSIGGYAFSRCSSLSTVISEIENPFAIDNSVFSGIASNATLIVPKGKKSIYQSTAGWNQFANIAESSGKCGDNVYYSYDGVTHTLTISGEGVMWHWEEDFDFSPWCSFSNIIRSIIINSGVTSIGNWAFADFKSLTSVTIPSSVTTIRDCAFLGCSGLTSVTIPNGVIMIEVDEWGGAFRNCTGLTSLIIPKSVTSIGSNAFRGCSGLTSIQVESGNQKYDSRDNCNAIIETSSNTLISGCKNTIIPNSVTSIGESAFYGCSGLTSVTIPNSVTSIGWSAFSGCSGLTSVTIPNSVTSIRGYTFYGCSGLTSVTIPNSVTSIGSYAFSGCSGLTTITSEIKNPFAIEESVFGGIPSNATLIVPPGTKSAYQSKAVWNKFQNIEESVGVTVTAISYSIVYGDALPIYGYISTGAALSGTPSISCSATAASPVGTYTITVSKGSVTNKYDSYVNGTLTINKAPLTVTAKNYIIKQGQALPTFEATYSGFKNSETSSVLTTQPLFSCSATSASEPGTYDIIVSGAAAQNYDISYEKGTLTIINADPVAVTANSYTITYGDALPTYGYTSIGAALSGTPSISCSATATSPAGTYPITISKGSVTNNNDIYVNGTLTINKAPLTITAKNYITKQGESLPTFEATYSGFKNNETSSVLTTQPSFNCSATSGSALGTYDIIVSGAAAQNYNFIYVKGTLTITDTDPVAVTANSYTITYGDALPTYEYTSIGAALKGTPSVSCSATATSPAGIYPITISKGSVTNYNDIYVNGTLTINKAPLTITAKNYIIKQGESLPTFEATYSGFKNSETSSVLTTQPSFNCSATSVSEPGTYDIIVSGAAAQNYSMSYVKGTLTITADDTPVLLGDANNDGVVDAADIVELVNAKAGHPSASFNLNNADANADGNFTEADITATANIIMKR